MTVKEEVLKLEEDEVKGQSWDGRDFVLGFKEALPLAMGIFSYGLVYGVLATQAGLTLAETLLMSLLVFAGASQFMAVGMIATGAAPGQIILATLLINLRHLLMGASLAPYLHRVRTWLIALSAHGMNDEAFALTINRFHKTGGSISYFLGAGAVTGVAWMLASGLGGGAGNFLGDPEALGLDFAFTGAFIGLLLPQIKGRLNWSVAGVAAVLAVAASLAIPGKWYIIIAALGAAIFGMVMENVAGGSSVNHNGDGRSNLSD